MDSRPNILLLTSDQQHYDTLGVTNPKIRTPALDRIAAEGVRFSRAYCPNPTCSPTRASILTGQYPSAHGCWAIGVKLPEDVPTVGGEFRRNGYRSILIGKAHFQPLRGEPGSESLECQPILRDLDFWREFHGPWYGFDHVETARMHADESHVGQHYAIWMEERGFLNWANYFQPWPPVAPSSPRPERPYYERDERRWSLPAEFHHTHWVGERTIAAIEESARAGRPFFLWSSFFDPHPPYIAPEPWASMYEPGDMEPGEADEGEFDGMPDHYRRTREERPDFTDFHESGGQAVHGFHSHLRSRVDLQKDMAVYYGMVSFIDAEIGRILAKLDELGIAGNTLVVFTTDHGHFLGQHGLVAKGPFHYEDLIRVPFLVRQPGTVPEGRVSDALQSLVDLAPTFLAASGLPVPGIMQGVSQWKAWQGDMESVRSHVVVENRHNPTTVHLRTYVEDRYKITVYRNGDDGELFDLREDPDERRNLWNEPSAREMKLRLLHRFVQADMENEPTRMARIAVA